MLKYGLGRWIRPLATAAIVAAGAFSIVGSGGGGGEEGGGSTPTRTVSVRIDSALGSGESFGFSLGSQSITVGASGSAVAFGTALAQGANYTVNQTSGPRTCTLSANRTGTIGTANVLVTADCGAPPTTYTVSVVVTSPIAGGETFVFTRGGGVNASITQQNVNTTFAGTLANGAAWTVTQLSGPRACTITPSNGIVSGANVLASAACGNPPALTQLSGELRGPVGTQVTLRNNGGDDLPLTVTAAGTDLYDAKPFTFATAMADGAAYNVTVPVKPANQTCRAYKGGTGTMPVGTGALKVGCEFSYELVSRNGNNQDHQALKPMLGGAAVAVGNTTTAYGEGRFVVFMSAKQPGFSPNGNRQIFWRDRLTGETLLVSANAAGEPGDQNSDIASISADGLVVVFESYATNLVPGDTNGVRDVFLWSRAGDSVPAGIQRISVAAGGVQANGHSHTAVVSGDGRIVAYTTEAGNISGNGSTTTVIRRDVLAGTNVVVSKGPAGQAANFGSDRAAISENGNRIAFWSFASNLVAGDTNGLWDIFVYQHSDGSMRRVSLRADGGERNQGESTSAVHQPAISGNGRFVAYPTASSDVVSGDTNGVHDIFVVDLDAAGLDVRRASVGPGNVQGNAASGSATYWEHIALSYDGTWMAFVSDATNFGTTTQTTGLRNVFLRNLGTGEIRVLTDSSIFSNQVSISRSGAYVSFTSGLVLDSRFASSGGYAHFTNLERAWFWVD